MAGDWQTLLTLANIVAILSGLYLNLRRQGLDRETQIEKRDLDAYQMLSEDYQRILAERNDLLIKLDKAEQELEMLRKALRTRGRGSS